MEMKLCSVTPPSFAGYEGARIQAASGITGSHYNAQWQDVSFLRTGSNMWQT